MSGRATGRVPRGKSVERVALSFELSSAEVNRRLQIKNDKIEFELGEVLKVCDKQSGLLIRREVQLESSKAEVSDLQEKITECVKEKEEERADSAEILNSLKDDHRRELRKQKRAFEKTVKDLEENLLLVSQGCTTW